MSFTISRNKMTFASTEARSSLKITTTDDKAIEKGTTHVIATLSFNANDAIHHGHALIACSFPSTPVAQLPSLSLTCTAGGYVETIPFTVATQSDNFMRGHCVLSQCSAYTEVKVNITAQAGAHFIAKANTAIHVSLEPNDAMLTESIMPVPPAIASPTVYAFTATQIMYNIVFSGRYEYIGTAVISGRDDHTVTSWLAGSDPLVRASDGLASDYGMYLRTDGHYALVFFSDSWGGSWTHVYPGDANGDRGSNLDGTPFTTLESVIQAGTLTTKWGFSGQTQQFVTSASDRSPYKKLPASQNDVTVTEIVPGVVGGFTLSNSTADYDGQWFYAGNVRRVGPSFASSTDIGIYRHDYGSDTYVLFYYAEGVAAAPSWALTKFGNNTGANAIAPNHDFLSTASMTGLHIEYVSGSSQTVNGTQYPPANALGGTMVIG